MPADEPSSSQVPKTTCPKRGTTIYRPSGRSIPELLSDPIVQSQIVDIESARAELEKRFLITPASEITLDTLITALLDFTIQTPGLSVLCVDILRAIGILLFKVDHDKKTHIIANSIKSVLAESTTQLEESIKRKALSLELEKSNLISLTARAEDAADAVASSINEAKSIIDILTPSIDTLQTKINEVIKKLTDAPQNHERPPNSYSEVAARKPAHTPGPADRALARAAIRARQIMIDPTPGNLLFPTGTNHADMVSKLREALSKIKPINFTDEDDIKAITQLRNGGIIIEMKTKTSTDWLRSPIGRTSLLEELKLPANFRDFTLGLVIQYLPTNLPIDRKDFLDLVANENQLDRTSLSTIRWIKPPHRRPAGQFSAFAMLQVTNAETANQLLRDGIYIDRIKTRVCKDRREPIRCAKCQNYGHIAKNCQSTKDHCGTCNKEHRTSDCTSNVERDAWCVSCNSGDHTSWSRACPIFNNKCKTMNDNYPENNMPYYPTEEPWTQVLLPPKTPPYQKPQANEQIRPNAHRQMTLGEAIRPRPPPNPHTPRPNRDRQHSMSPATGANTTDINRPKPTNRFSSLSLDPPDLQTQSIVNPWDPSNV